MGDDIYVFMLHKRAYPKFYHMKCFSETRESRQRGVIYQDRAYRKRDPGITIEEWIEADEYEPTEFEKFEKAFRKQHGHEPGFKIG